MGHYISNLRDIDFTLFEVLGRGDVLGHGPFTETDEEMARDVLAQVDRLAREDLAESFEADDRNTTVYDPEARTVTVPEGMRTAYRTWMDSGFWNLGLPEEIGGQPAPASLVWAMSELVLGAHPGVYLYNMGPAFAAILHSLGTAAFTSIEGSTVAWPRVEVSCQYLSPARFGDVLDIHLRIARKGTSSLTYAFTLSTGGRLVARGRMSSVCCILRDGDQIDPIPMPETLSRRLAASSATEDQQDLARS